MKHNKMITIDKNIPLQPFKSFQYPFIDMEIGDSFFKVITKNRDIGKIQRNIFASIVRYRLNNKDKKFCTRRVEKEGTIKEGIRVWRIK